MNKSILITGATKGIGLAITTYLNKLNYEVIGIARNKPNNEFPGSLYLADLSNYEDTAEVLTLSSMRTKLMAL